MNENLKADLEKKLILANVRVSSQARRRAEVQFEVREVESLLYNLKNQLTKARALENNCEAAYNKFIDERNALLWQLVEDEKH